jgi:hypothetical protein
VFVITADLSQRHCLYVAERLCALVEAESCAGGNLATGSSNLTRAGGTLQVFTNPRNPKIKSRILWANHPHIQNSYGLKEYKEQPKGRNSLQQTGEVEGQARNWSKDCARWKALCKQQRICLRRRILLTKPRPDFTAT